MSSTRVT